MSFVPVTACRSCDGPELLPVLDLGEQPLANAFRRPADTSPEARYPLALVFCPACSLVQLTGNVPPAELFDDYPYFSSYSDSMVEAMRLLADRLTTAEGLDGDSLVVEVASNDGYLLKHYLERGVAVLGVEPAANVAQVAVAAGVPTLAAYFGVAAARAVLASHGPAHVLHANNVMAHVPDVNDLVAGFALLLADDGVAVVESPYLGRFVSDVEFDTTYHEHVFYYSLTALDVLLRRHGLVVSDLEHLDVHGGSLRCFVRHEGAPVGQAVTALLAEEDRLGVRTPAYYRDFAERVDRLRARTLALLHGLKASGATLHGYGAAAKGTVLLNHFGIGPDLLDKVVDRSPHKQGLEMPGVGLAIEDPAALLRDRPSHVLLLAWNLLDEVLEQQAAYREQGGLFVVPIPEPRVV